MSGMSDREKAIENRFVHDEELKFKALARRNRLIGLWAAGKLGKADADADAYARDVVIADFVEAGDDDVFRKLRDDFAAAGVKVTDADIRAKMADLLTEAVHQVEDQ